MTRFSKYEGTGNDFIVIDDWEETFPVENTAYISKLCHRKFGIGADGLILLQPSTDFDVRMRIFNADASEAESCGNGLCCLMQFMKDLGFPHKEYEVELVASSVKGKIGEEKISIRFADPFFIDLPSELTVNGESTHIHLIDTGVPHVVSFVDDLEKIDVKERGSEIRWHRSLEPKGANVNFAQRQRDGSIRVRTFERGVEGETLGCGTGATAVGLIASRLFYYPSPVKVRFPGGEIEIYFDLEKDRFLNVQMLGSANLIFSGQIPVRNNYKGIKE